MRPPWSPLVQWYTARVQQLTWRDEFAGKRFLEVMHLLRTPRALLLPYILMRALAPQAAS